MIVDHAGRLHEGVADCAADEAEAALLQVLAHGIRLRCRGRNLLQVFPSVLSWFAAHKAPDIAVETPEFPLRDEEHFRIVDRRLDLEAVADNAGILEQSSDFLPAEACDFLSIKSGESAAVVLALLEYGVPTQTRLRAFEDEEFEPFAVVMDRDAPLVVVIGDFEFVD